MNRVRCGCVVVLSVFCWLASGCAAIRVGYEAETRVIPDGGEFVVEFNISENLAGGKSRLVSSPRLRLSEGGKGEVTIGDDHSSLKCTALVQRTAGGTRAMTRVRIRKGDREVWTAQQTMAVGAESQERTEGEPSDK